MYIYLFDGLFLNSVNIGLQTDKRCFTKPKIMGHKAEDSHLGCHPSVPAQVPV